MSTATDIERTSRERQEAWAAGEFQRAEALTKRLDGLYEAKRIERADHGSEKARKRAVKKALVEKELERLMTD